MLPLSSLSLSGKGWTFSKVALVHMQHTRDNLFSQVVTTGFTLTLFSLGEVAARPVHAGVRAQDNHSLCFFLIH